MSFTMIAAVAAAGCGGPSVVSPAEAPTTSPGVTQSPLPTVATSGTAGGSSVDGNPRLAAALKPMAAGYRFDTTVTIAGQSATHSAGRWLGGRSEFVVEAGGTALTYRSIPPRSWVYQDGTGWVELVDKATSGDPLEPLRHPTSVTVASEGADGLVLQATYPPSALGVAGTTPVIIQVSISPDGRATASYTVATTSGPATTVTVLVAGKGDPITVPSPAG